MFASLDSLPEDFYTIWDEEVRMKSGTSLERAQQLSEGIACEVTPLQSTD